MQPGAEPPPGRVSRCGLLGRGELQLQGRECLAQTVVNLARDARALILPDVLLPRRQTAQRRPRGAQLCFGAFGLGDVAVCAQRAVLAAELEAHEREQSGTWWTVSRFHLELDIVDDAGLGKHVDDLGAPRGMDEVEFD